jgi:hypothetical protein
MDKIWPFAAVGKSMTEFYIMFDVLPETPSETFVRFQLITRTRCNSLPFFANIYVQFDVGTTFAYFG